jgi:hypothetical protein
MSINGYSFLVTWIFSYLGKIPTCYPQIEVVPMQILRPVLSVDSDN